MKTYRLTMWLIIILSVVSFSNAFGNPIVNQGVKELIEFFGEKGGKKAVQEVVEAGGEKAAREFVAFGGETAAREVLEKAYLEGGEALTKKVVKYSGKYGISALRGMRQSPKIFLQALDDMPDNLITSALQSVKREPELLAQLTSKYGSKALEVAAQHPGVGPQIASKLGKEGIDLALDLPTEAAIKLNKIAGPLQKLDSTQRSAIIDIIKKAPEKTLDLLETHPRVLYTSAAVASFLAAKDQILGDSVIHVDDNGQIQVVDKHGLIGRTVNGLLNTKETRTAISAIFYVVALVIGYWGMSVIVGSIRKRKIKEEY